MNNIYPHINIHIIHTHYTYTLYIYIIHYTLYIYIIYIYINVTNYTDLNYVNNKEFSDVTFCVEDKMFYAHKIVIVTGKYRLLYLLNISQYLSISLNISLHLYSIELNPYTPENKFSNLPPKSTSIGPNKKSLKGFCLNAFGFRDIARSIYRPRGFNRKIYLFSKFRKLLVHESF